MLTECKFIIKKTEMTLQNIKIPLIIDEGFGTEIYKKRQNIG